MTISQYLMEFKGNVFSLKDKIVGLHRYQLNMYIESIL